MGTCVRIPLVAHLYLNILNISCNGIDFKSLAGLDGSVGRLVLRRDGGLFDTF